VVADVEPIALGAELTVGRGEVEPDVARVRLAVEADDR
jgi:hypothetical protein